MRSWRWGDPTHWIGKPWYKGIVFLHLFIRKWVHETIALVMKSQSALRKFNVFIRLCLHLKQSILDCLQPPPLPEYTCLSLENNVLPIFKRKESWHFPVFRNPISNTELSSFLFKTIKWVQPLGEVPTFSVPAPSPGPGTVPGSYLLGQVRVDAFLLL